MVKKFLSFPKTQNMSFYVAASVKRSSPEMCQFLQFKAGLPRLAARTSIFKAMGLKDELSNALKEPVDIVTLPLKIPSFKIEKVVKIYERA